MIKSWDSSVDVATGYGLDDRGSIPGRGARPALGPIDASYPVRIEGYFPGE
jgi:hypothetical protein